MSEFETLVKNDQNFAKLSKFLPLFYQQNVQLTLQY